ncbi:hypothetical protein [Polaromonas sp. CG9_12]|nr:hypothetical protein [Polaromonas sp. CG9_12]
MGAAFAQRRQAARTATCPALVRRKSAAQTLKLARTSGFS